MKNEIVAKVNKIGKVGQIIANIGKVITVMGMAACLISGVVLMAMPDDLVVIHMEGKAIVEVNIPGVVEAGILTEEEAASMVFGDVQSSLEVNDIEYGIVGMTPTENGFLVDAESDSYTLEFRQIANTVFISAVYCAAAYVVLHFISKLCKQFKECETPFTEEIVQALKKLAIALIPMALFSGMAESVTDSIMTGNANIVIGVDLTTILLVLLVFMLSAIFNYGAMLQQESDETL